MTQNPVKRKCPSFGPENVTLLGETDIEHEKISFLWTVRNYSIVRGLDYIKSPVFYGTKSKHGWQLKMHPKRNIDGMDYISLYLILANSEDDKGWWGLLGRPNVVRAKFRFSILDGNGQLTDVVTSGNNEVVNFRVSGGWGDLKFISCWDLAKLKLVVDNKLNVFCEVEVLGELKQSLKNGGLKSEEDEERKKRSRSEALADFGKMFKESIATDVTISTGTASFRAHKAVLSARSSIFAAMFYLKMLEKEMATVEIHGFEDKVVEGMLEYLYTGETDCLPEKASELLQLAERYNLVGLKEDCQRVIGDKQNGQGDQGNMVDSGSFSKCPVLEANNCKFIVPIEGSEIFKGFPFQDKRKDDSPPSG